jgi:hypothetical protein
MLFEGQFSIWQTIKNNNKLRLPKCIQKRKKIRIWVTFCLFTVVFLLLLNELVGNLEFGYIYIYIYIYI